MNKDQAQKIIDEAIEVESSDTPYPDNYSFEAGAQFMLQLLRDRPELLVVFKEVEELVEALKKCLAIVDVNGTHSLHEFDVAERAVKTALKPFTKDET